MKGIVHFVTGVALGTFFPEAVQLASHGSFILVLGGIGGLLPDTIDFKFAQFVEEPDIDIDPHPESFAAQDIAEAIAAAIERVQVTGRRQVLKLNTMRLGPDWWQQYLVQFDPSRGQVMVELGPIVNTSQVPLPESQRAEPIGVAEFNAKLLPTYGDSYTVDIFNGPSFLIERRNGQVEMDFIPWHRQYSHSFVMAMGFGIICWLLFGPLAGIVGGLGVLGHIFEDQLGYLGSNLFYPITQIRSQGLRLVHAVDAIPNFFTFWTMILFIVFNLDRFSDQPTIEPVMFWSIGWLPAAALLVYYFFKKFQNDLHDRHLRSIQQEADLRAETQELADA